MRKFKLFYFVALAAIFTACGNSEPTIVRFISSNTHTTKVNEPIEFVVEVQVPQGEKGTTSIVLNQSDLLPSWVTFVDNGNKTAKLSGTPSVTGTFNLTFKATNNGVSTEQKFTLVINENGINPGEGDGTETNPYTCTQVLQFYAEGSESTKAGSWVKGYIVGGVKNTLTDGGNAIVSSSDVVFGTNDIRSTAVLLAADQNETDYTKCLVIKLNDSGTNPADFRNNVNLADNPTNLKKELAVKGNFARYFAVPGVRDITNYIFDNVPPTPTDAVLNETLLTQASFDKFTSFSVLGEQFWTLSTQYGAMMSGFAENASHANEDWFVTPAMNLTDKLGTLTFDHARGPASAINVGVQAGWYSVWVSTNYNGGNPTTANWTELTGITHGTTAWQFVNSGVINLPAAAKTANCRIAFKYICSDNESATWEIKNVIVK